MTAIIIITTIIFVGIVVVQIARLTELSSLIRGVEESEKIANNRNALGMLFFLVLFLAAVVWSALYYMPYMLGYGPNNAASLHGGTLDNIFNITLFFTGIVFFATQILLFWYAYKYRKQEGRKAVFISHNNKLEVIWTIVPAVVMAFLVINGLDSWNETMADVDKEEVAGKDYIEVEVTGHQFAWTIRYPGNDNLIGRKDYKLISTENPLGQDWNDDKNFDDTHPSEIVVPKGKKVRVRITSKDVLHNFYLPHFRVKMDAVPGMPTYFVFTPNITTEEYRAKLGALDKSGNPKYTEWHQPADPTNPTGKKRYEGFEFELACAELCGKGHFSMKRIIRVVEEEEYQAWLKEQKSFYKENISKEASTSAAATDSTSSVSRVDSVSVGN